MFLLSSHLIELESEIKKFNNISFFCFEGMAKGGKSQFSYLLKEGVSAERLGLLILENENVIELLKPTPRISDPGMEV